jgi:hypothetical protein
LSNRIRLFYIPKRYFFSKFNIKFSIDRPISVAKDFACQINKKIKNLKYDAIVTSDSNTISFLNTKNVFILFITVFMVGTFALEYEEEVPNYIHKYLPEFCAILGLLLVLKSFSERNNVILSWILILMNHFFNSISTFI